MKFEGEKQQATCMSDGKVCYFHYYGDLYSDQLGLTPLNQSQFRTLRKSIILILNNLLNRIAQWLHSITAKQTISVLRKLSLVNVNYRFCFELCL